MRIRRAAEEDRPALVALMAAFRVALARLRGLSKAPDEEAAEQELAEYAEKGFPIFVAVEESQIVGYLLCRLDRKTVWAEHLFIRPEHRRRGIASALYAEAERLAEQLGGRTVFNWIHPNNDAIVKFLKGRGYDVLNLVEVRRPVGDERFGGTVQVGEHEFRY